MGDVVCVRVYKCLPDKKLFWCRVVFSKRILEFYIFKMFILLFIYILGKIAFRTSTF